MELNVKLNLLLLVLTSIVLTACGQAPNVDRSRAVGVETALGQSLTKTKWCTPASTDDVDRPNFSTLDLRQTGKFFRSTYTLGEDRSLKLESKEQGTWALIFDKLFTRIEGRADEVEAKITLVEDTSSSGQAAAKISASKNDPAEDSCVQLAVFGHDPETFCPCNFVKN